MMTLRKILLLSGVIGCCLASPRYDDGPVDRVSFGACTSDDDCGAGECCALEPNRYGVPSCRPHREEGDVCRPGSPLILNSTLTYPDGTEIALKAVHYIICPCAEHLACHRRFGVCGPGAVKKYKPSRSNHL